MLFPFACTPPLPRQADVLPYHDNHQNSGLDKKLNPLNEIENGLNLE